MDGTQQQGPSLFQSLPLELRRQIYSYLLPYSVRRHDCGKKIPVWQLGSTSILATNRQIHDEAADLMYGNSWFWFIIDNEEIDFVFECFKRDIWSEKSRPIPRESFFKDIGPRNVSRISHLQVGICGVKYEEVLVMDFMTSQSAIDEVEPMQYPITLEGYQQKMNALAGQVSMFSKLLELNPNVQDVRVTVQIQRKELDVRFEYALAKPLLELNSRRKLLLAGHFHTEVEQELWLVIQDHTSNP